MLEYVILESTERHGPSDLTEQVRAYIAKGWAPLGGVTVSITDNRGYGVAYCQAMTRELPEAPKAERSEAPEAKPEGPIPSSPVTPTLPESREGGVKGRELFTREVCGECKDSALSDCIGALPCSHCSGGYVYSKVEAPRGGSLREAAQEVTTSYRRKDLDTVSWAMNMGRSIAGLERVLSGSVPQAPSQEGGA